MKKKRIIIVLLVLVFVALLFSSCAYPTRDENKLWSGFNFYVDENENEDENEYLSIPWEPDENWRWISYWFFSSIYKSPDNQLLILYWTGGHGEMYVKQGGVDPYYDNLVYDRIEIYSADKINTGIYMDGYPFITQKTLQNATFSVFADESNKISRAVFMPDCVYKYYVKLHCEHAFSWLFYVVEYQDSLYIYSPNEGFGYLVVDEFADWLRTLEPSQN